MKKQQVAALTPQQVRNLRKLMREEIKAEMKNAKATTIQNCVVNGRVLDDNQAYVIKKIADASYEHAQALKELAEVMGSKFNNAPTISVS